MRHILIVEDEPEIQELLAAYLRHAGYGISLAADGVEAIALFHREAFDLVLLDIMLPKIDGFGVCELLRRESSVPIVMLTALDGEETQLRGFALKIDDYVTKPFSMPILLQKIAAVLRRAGGAPLANTLLCQGVCLDLDTRTCTVAEVPVSLTRREFDLLAQLLSAPGRVFTREILLNQVWGYDFLGDARIVDSHIKNLRKKLAPFRIETVRGVGYRAAK